jgi:hypothetical protein
LKIFQENKGCAAAPRARKKLKSSNQLLDAGELRVELFVFGAMNLVAAIGLAALVVAKMMFPVGACIGRLAGAAFVSWGVLLLVGF